MGVKVTPPNFDKLLEKYSGMENNMGIIAAECVEQGSAYVYDRFKEGLEQHRRTGAAVNSLVKKDMKTENGVYSIEIGTFYESAQREGFLHAVYQEYGTPRFPADPWARPVADTAKAALSRIWRDIMKQHEGGAK